MKNFEKALVISADNAAFIFMSDIAELVNYLLTDEIMSGLGKGALHVDHEVIQGGCCGYGLLIHDLDHLSSILTELQASL